MPRAADEMVQTGDIYHWTYVHDFAHGGAYTRIEPERLVQFTFGSMTVDIHLHLPLEIDQIVRLQAAPTIINLT